MARPREFDEDQALMAAMDTFWTHGYKGTSMADLMRVMNLKKGSIYLAFGDKHSLFLQAFQRYADTLYGAIKDTITKATSPAAGMENFLTEFLVEAIAGQKTCRGCFVVNSAVELAPHDAEVAKILTRQKKRTEVLFKEAIEEGQKLGEFDTNRPASEIAETLYVFMCGTAADYKSSSCKDRVKRLTQFMNGTLKA